MISMKRLPHTLTLAAVLIAVWSLSALAQQPASPRFSRDDLVFFEEKVRPLLHNQCLMCHSREKKTSGLSLETREEILTGGNRGPAAEPGKPDHSRLLQALTFTGDLKMPPTGQLKPEEIAVFKHWVEAGLPWPEDRTRVAQQTPSTHWSFQPPRQSGEPLLKDKTWPRNSIDKFVLARLEKEGLRPSPAADKVTLIRRLSLDLLGLPPAPADVDAFLSDRRPDAYERLVDRLLASKHYGERWARHWLDMARYADTNGFGFDRARVMWRYRDWVIHSLNQDMPFDQFVIEQLAGDLLPNATLDQKVATGFHRNTMINEEGGVDQEQYRIEAVFDRVKTTGAAFLGLTTGCAQCHDHKYDPISQREFYQLFAFFNNQDEPSLQIVRPGQVDDYRKISAEYAVERLRLQGDIAQRNQEIITLLPAWESKLRAAERQSLPSNVQAIFKVPPAARELAQVEDLEKFYKESDTEYQARLRALDQFLETPSDRNPNQFTAMVLQERDTPRPTHVLVRGDFLKPGVKVWPDVPAVLPPLEKRDTSNPSRLDLARWLVCDKNPLTARVSVNRVWQRYFGRGLVKTVEDFGTQGEKPSHPELLDWLASEFMRQGWSQKALHRSIVTSATYRQSSKVTPELKERDPENILLARSPRMRVEAEIVRDIALTASGLIQHRIGGPSVLPPQPAGVTDLSRGNLIWVTATGPDRYRRGMYTFWKRTSPYPGMTVFDAPTADEATVQRIRSNTPLQALTTLNDEVFVEAAQALALRVIREAQPDDRARLRHGFRLCLSREPDTVEDATLWNILSQEQERFRQKPDAAKALVPKDAPASLVPAQYAPWFSLARVLLNLDETITRE